MLIITATTTVDTATAITATIAVTKILIFVKVTFL